MQEQRKTNMGPAVSCPEKGFNVRTAKSSIGPTAPQQNTTALQQ